MAALPEPYIPDINRTLANYGTGYALGQDQRKQNALTQAGEFMAKNDQTGARNALYSAGQMSEGLQIDDRMRAAARQAREDQLAKAKRSNEVIGNLAMLADTPEKWAVAIGTAKKAGLSVDNWMDFGTRDYVLAQAGKVREFLDLELKDRALAAKQQAAQAGGKPPSGYRATADGNMAFIPGGPADPALKVKETQYSEGASKAANFANMMQQSEAVLAPFKENPLDVVGQMNEMWPEGMANRMRDPAYQAYRQSAMQWVRAKLRKESGAAISTPEFEGEFQTFFPQPGDTPQVIQQKTQAREAALMGMKAESRGAYEQLFQGVQPGAGAAPGGAPMQGGAPNMQPPPQNMQPPPQMQQQGAAPPPPPQALQMLKLQPTPERMQQFDEIFGPGAAQRALGGQP